MIDSEIYGTLKITTAVAVGVREKLVTLATITGVTRSECESKIQEFVMDNPRMRRACLYAEWIVREPVIVRVQREPGMDSV
jgi:hypothetical protein